MGVAQTPRRRKTTRSSTSQKTARRQPAKRKRAAPRRRSAKSAGLLAGLRLPGWLRLGPAARLTATAAIGGLLVGGIVGYALMPEGPSPQIVAERASPVPQPPTKTPEPSAAPVEAPAATTSDDSPATGYGDAAREELGDVFAALQPEPAPDVLPRVRPEPPKPAAAAVAPSAEPARTARIAIVIDDMGENDDETRDALSLPSNVTFAYLPYPDDIRGKVAAARAEGHEIMLHLPMEPSVDKNPGPHALKVEQSWTERQENLIWNLTRFDGYVGVNNHMGSRLTPVRPIMDQVMNQLAKRDVYFLDSRTNAKSQGAAAAQGKGIPTLSRDVFLDNVPDVPAVNRQLAQLEQIALKHGQAVGIGHPFPATVDALEAWLPGLEAKGIEVVPMSRLTFERPPS